MLLLFVLPIWAHDAVNTDFPLPSREDCKELNLNSQLNLQFNYRSYF